MPSAIQTYFENSQLSLASYADLAEGMTTAAYITELKEVGFTDLLATQFAATYSIVSVSPANVNGFSATLFQKNDGSNERFLAIRGTNDLFWCNKGVGSLFSDAMLVLWPVRFIPGR